MVLDLPLENCQNSCFVFPGARLAKLQCRAPFLGKEAESEEASRGGEEEEEVSWQSISSDYGPFCWSDSLLFDP